MSAFWIGFVLGMIGLLSVQCLLVLALGFVMPTPAALSSSVDSLDSHVP